MELSEKSLRRHVHMYVLQRIEIERPAGCAVRHLPTLAEVEKASILLYYGRYGTMYIMECK